MERGLYAAATGMMALQSIQDTLAQNVANSSTVGYKQDVPTFKALHSMALRRQMDGCGRGSAIGQIGLGVAADRVYTDWQNGPIATTGNALDASLAPGQFFALETPGGTRYTRSGNFQLDSTGTLTTSNGLKVLGADGKAIQISGGSPPKIEPNGDVTVGGKAVNRLQIVDASRDAVAKDGENLFRAVDPRGIRPAPAPALHPGTLEQSNVNVVSGMVRMITVSRGFDMAQRAIVTQDEMLKHAANELART